MAKNGYGGNADKLYLVIHKNQVIEIRGSLGLRPDVNNHDRFTILAEVLILIKVRGRPYGVRCQGYTLHKLTRFAKSVTISRSFLSFPCSTVNLLLDCDTADSFTPNRAPISFNFSPPYR